MHPFTALAVGFSGWILVMGMNTPWVSAAVVGVALVLGTARAVSYTHLTLPTNREV